MAWELSEEHEAFRAVVRDFADEGDRTARRAVGRGGPLPGRGRGGDGRARAVRAGRPRGVGRQRRRLRLAVRRHRGARPGGPERGHHAVGRRRPRRSTRSSASATTTRRRRWLPDLVAGRAIGAFGLTEPDGGSDAGATRTRARRDGDDWVIDGSKAFITNSGTPITSVVTVTARTDDGHLGVRRRGRHAGADRRAGLPQARLACQRHPRPDARRLPRPRGATCSARPGAGFRNFLAILDDGRIAIAALALGCARACLDEAVAYAKERHAFGRPIGANQADRVRARRPGRRRRELAQPRLQGGVAEGPAAARSARPRRWPSCTPPRPR